jgi:hypothetical protein
VRSTSGDLVWDALDPRGRSLSAVGRSQWPGLAGAAFPGVGALAPVVRRSEVVVVGITALALIADAEGLGDVSISPHVSGVGRRRLVPLMRMDSFEVGEHDVSVECVMVVKSGVLDHGVRDGVYVLADELATTARAGLFVGHG